MKRRLNDRGFTLIEVVLVLALGGLIFVLAFLSFAQASKNRRDAQRRSDVQRMVSEAENFSSESTLIQYPCFDSPAWSCTTGSWTKFINSYINTGNFKDPKSGVNYGVYGYNGSITFNLSAYFRDTSPLGVGFAVYGLRATCVNGDLVTNTTNPPTYVAFWIVNESGQGTCADNR